MNNLVNVQSVFSVFGNFSSLVSNIEAVKKEFEGFETVNQQETLPNGLQVPFYVLHKENKAVVIRASRMDVQYGYNGDSDSFDHFLEFSFEAVNKLDSHLTSKLNRVSYSNVAFLERNAENFKKLSEIFSANNVFGKDVCELQVRLNNIVEVDNESINAVFLTQDGHVSKKGAQGQAPQAVIFLNNDINTLAENREARFALKDAYKLMSDLLMLANERTNKVLEKL
jgi:hypothetical protein